MVLFIMAIHIVAVLAILALWARGALHLPAALLPTVALLPLWGPMCAVAEELHVRGGEKADLEAESGRFGITDEVYRSIRMEEDGVSDVRPMEDVLESGSPAQRRSMLLSVLHQGPEAFVRPLRMAGINDDTEVVHYAVTALVELRGSYAARLARADQELSAHPNDADALRASARLDEDYLRSGIPEAGERRDRASHCREMLEKLLWNPALRGGGNEERAGILRRICDICLLQEDAGGAEEAARRLIEERPGEESGYLFLVRAKALAHDGKGLAETIRRIRERGVYLTPEGRRELDFWVSG